MFSAPKKKKKQSIERINNIFVTFYFFSYKYFRTVRTFPGMRVTAETTKYKPMIQW